MSADELYTLTKNDYHSSFSESLKNLRKEGDFTDVTLVSSDCRDFHMHKVVLSSCSEYFKNILKVTYVAEGLFFHLF